MYRKRLVFGAGVCSMLILCSFSSAITMSMNLDQLIVNPGGPYYGTVNKIIDICIKIIGGVPPYEIFIDWGDGSNDTFAGINENEKCFCHNYSSSGVYIVTIMVTDTENNTDWCQTVVTISEIKCDLGIDIEKHDQLLAVLPSVFKEIYIDAEQEIANDDQFEIYFFGYADKQYFRFLPEE